MLNQTTEYFKNVCTKEWSSPKDSKYIDTLPGRNFEVLRKSAISTISVVRMAFNPLDCC